MNFKEELKNYFDWAETNWSRLACEKEKDISIMSLGLAGEFGEVSEVLLNSKLDIEKIDIDDLTKELGDFFYYLSKISRTFAIDLGGSLEKFWEKKYKKCITLNEMADSLRGNASFDSIILANMELGVKVGLSLEILKKRFRDNNFDREKLKKELTETTVSFLKLCGTLNIEPTKILNASVRKIEDRKKRNVMAGSGNNR